MGVSYSKKTKCQGCKALRYDTAKGFTCALDIPIIATDASGTFISPVPTQKCWKPKSDKDFIALKRNRKKVVNAA